MNSICPAISGGIGMAFSSVGAVPGTIFFSALRIASSTLRTPVGGVTPPEFPPLWDDPKPRVTMKAPAMMAPAAPLRK